MSRKKPSSLVYLLTFLSLVSGTSFLCNFPLGLKTLALVSIPRSQTINQENINRAEHKPSPNTEKPKGSTVSAGGTRYVPPDRGAPSSTRGGASRGGVCDQDQSIPSLPLIALRPANSLAGGIGLTLESQPQFLVYLPQTLAEKAEFTLKDEQGNNVYQAEFPINGKAGIISISLPKNSIKLELDKDYDWYFSIICNPKNRVKDSSVNGWIRRELPPKKLADELQNAAEKERPRIYAQHGIWHEALTNLAELIRQNPNDPALITDWKTLLEAVQIAGIGEQPFSLTKIELPPKVAAENQ